MISRPDQTRLVFTQDIISTLGFYLPGYLQYYSVYQVFCQVAMIKSIIIVTTVIIINKVTQPPIIIDISSIRRSGSWYSGIFVTGYYMIKVYFRFSQYLYSFWKNINSSFFPLDIEIIAIPYYWQRRRGTLWQIVNLSCTWLIACPRDR